MKVITKTECYILGKNGLEKEVKRKLQRGQIFRLEYPNGNSHQKMAMLEEIKSEFFQGYKCVDLETFKFETIEHPRPESEMFGIGYYYTEGNIVSEVTLQDAISKVPEYDQKRKDKKEEFEKQARLESQRIKKQFDYLPAKMKNEFISGQEYKVAKKNLIFELKKAFPTVKFSVRKNGYNTMNIHYSEGVTVKQVKAITDKYEGEGFDGMTDSQYSKTTAFNVYYGSVGYLFITRNFSDQTFNDASNQLFGIDFNNLDKNHRWEDSTVVRRILNKVDFTADTYENLIMNLDFNNK